MAGERGSNYNAFTLFLIFILLYLSQKSVHASAFSESGEGKAQFSGEPEQPMEKQVAVSLSNGDVVEYTQEPVLETEESTEEEPVLEEEEAMEVVVEESELPELQEEAPVEQIEVPLEEELSQVSEIAGNNQEEDLPIEQIFKPILPEVTIEQPDIPEPAKEDTHQEEMQEVPLEDTQVAEEVKVTDELPVTEVTDEPVLGGQSNLFLKPTVMTGVQVKEVPSGPKISFKFGS